MRESIIRCNNCEETIVGPTSGPLKSPNNLTIMSNIASLPIRFNMSEPMTENPVWYLKLVLHNILHDNKNHDICSACLIKALNDAIKRLVAERLEGGAIII